MTAVTTSQAYGDMICELLDRGEMVSFTARGASMWPFIMDGDQVSVSPLTQSLSLGDVVFVPNAEFGQLHRVIDGPVDGRYRLRGDALPQDDGWVPSDRIRGRLVKRRRDGVERAMFGGRESIVLAGFLGDMRRVISRFRTAFLGK